MSNVNNTNKILQLMDDLLSLYYESKGMIYYNDDIGRFSEWCLVHVYDIDEISKQLRKVPADCTLTQFDVNFPTNNNIDCNNRENEIFQVIRYCWNTSNKCYLNVISNKQSIPNKYILDAIIEKQQSVLHGYLRHQYHSIPNDIINICGFYFIINKQNLCINIKPILWKPKTNNVHHDIALCELVYKLVQNNEYFIAYQIIYMVINNYDYHNHSSQTKTLLHLYIGLVSTQWNSLNEKNDMELAAELYSNCYYSVFWEMLADKVAQNCLITDLYYVFKAMRKISKNLLIDDEKYRTIYIDNIMVQQKILRHVCGYAFLRGVGFKQGIDQNEMVCVNSDKSVINIAVKVFTRRINELKKCRHEWDPKKYKFKKKLQQPKNENVENEAFQQTEEERQLQEALRLSEQHHVHGMLRRSQRELNFRQRKLNFDG